MTDLLNTSPATTEPTESERNTLLIAYICYAATLIGIAFGPIAGVIINHLKVDETRSSYLGSHHRWLLRTFWFSLAGFALSGMLIFTIILIPLAWLGCGATAIWYLYRVIRGALMFADRKPMPV
jgi:uncharacterized membrane protein